MQTAYLAALDPRVKAASIGCYMSTFEEDFSARGLVGYDGEQVWPHAAIYGLDKPDLLVARADKHTQARPLQTGRPPF